ncbi:MAG TPA: radical SAM protein, partial [Acholeplasmataceae bacterium]|nr:radical SAM protein [Acholeplasmataceae bacterium]
FKAHAAARKHLDYVYIGNHPEADTNTYCPNCGNLLIERKFYFTKNHLQEPACPRCGEKVPVIL